MTTISPWCAIRISLTLHAGGMRARLMRAITLLCLLAVPAFAQTPAQPSSQQTAPNPPAVPLPQWFVEIDTAKKGEVSRADFVKYRMKLFDELDTNKDGKLSLDEFLKVVEPPFYNDTAGGLNLEDRRTRGRAEFENIAPNSDG